MIRYEQLGRLGILTLNRPEVLNAINRQLLQELRDELERIRTDRGVRVLIITGAGSRAFCSGADLKERQTMSENEVRRFIDAIRDTFSLVERLPQPVIAAINGIAFGGGLELALACDLRIMSETASVGLTETRLGIIPGAGGTQRLARLIGIGAAKELIFTGRRVDAREARDLGLVNRIAPAEQLLDAAVKWGEEMAENAPLALAQAKWALHYGEQAGLELGLQMETMAYQVLIPSKDRLEGLRAFQEKRKPDYTGE